MLGAIGILVRDVARAARSRAGSIAVRLLAHAPKIVRKALTLAEAAPRLTLATAVEAEHAAEEVAEAVTGPLVLLRGARALPSRKRLTGLAGTAGAVALIAFVARRVTRR